MLSLDCPLTHIHTPCIFGVPPWRRNSHSFLFQFDQALSIGNGQRARYEAIEAAKTMANGATGAGQGAMRWMPQICQRDGNKNQWGSYSINSYYLYSSFTSSICSFFGDYIYIYLFIYLLLAFLFTGQAKKRVLCYMFFCHEGVHIMKFDSIPRAWCKSSFNLHQVSLHIPQMFGIGKTHVMARCTKQNMLEKKKCKPPCGKRKWEWFSIEVSSNL